MNEIIIYLAIFITAFIIVELIVRNIVKSINKDFQWLIIEKDEAPKLSKQGLRKFLLHGYDPELGWVRKPNTSHDEIGEKETTTWHIDERGSRKNPYLGSKESKISCYGDSFTFARQVNDNETWEYYLSELTKTNVQNFGVGNYGLDQAVLRLKRDFPKNPTKIVIMGVDFVYQEKMEALVEKFDLSKNLVIIKKPKREDVISAYNECKFLVLPSKWELSPLTPLEGFACKKTVISTTAHGIPYTISHNENCLLVPPSDPQIQNPLKCEKLAESGFKMVSNEANLDSMSNKIFSVYEKAIKLNNGNLG